MDALKSKKKLLVIGIILVAFFAYKGISHFHGRSGAALGDPEVDFYYSVRDEASRMSNAPACQYGARAMVSFASPTNSWPLDVRKQQVEKVIDATPSYCFPS